MELTEIKTFHDVILMADKIIASVELDRINDKVISLRCKMIEDLSIVTNSSETKIEHKPKCVIAGSKAVTLISKHLKLAQKNLEYKKAINDLLEIKGDFKAEDTDVFFLNSSEPHRIICNDVDIVHLTTPDVSTLLLNFDLPCCRAATDEDDNIFWISLHCLYSLLTGKFFLPEYLSNIDMFKPIFAKYCENVNNRVYACSEKKLFDRLSYRIKKYENRGYTCQYIDTDVILPWVLNRFHYDDGTAGYSC